MSLDLMFKTEKYFVQARKKATAIFTNHAQRALKCDRNYSLKILGSFCKCRLYAVNMADWRIRMF
jgi:hypothetical protein